MSNLAVDTMVRADQSGLGTASDGTNTWGAITNSATANIVSNEAVIGNCVSGFPSIFLGSQTTADIGFLVRVNQVNNFFDGVGPCFRAADVNNMYLIALYAGVSGIVFAKLSGGGFSSIATGAFQLNPNQYFWLRTVMIGNHLQCRIWADGDSEPGTWTIDTTDSTYSSAGQFGMSFNTFSSSSDVVKFDHVTVTDGTSISTNTRTIPASAVLISQGLKRTIPASAVLQSTLTRTIPASAVLKSTLTRTIPASAVLSLAATYQAHPAVMPIISRGVPAYTNDDFSGAFPASNANNSTYNSLWRCAATPAANANSGALTTPAYLAYDVSGVPSNQRGSCVLAWYNDPSTGAYDYTIAASNPNNIASGYTIDANAAAGGSLPGSGWVNLATVSGNIYHSRQHAIDLTGYNWVRIRVTDIIGSSSNNNVALNMDVHDASKGNQDNWIFFGDSICLQAFIHSDTTMPAQINAVRSKYFPLMEGAGIGGTTSGTGASNIATWLPNFSGTYVGLLYGTNDANNASAGDLNFGPTYITNMETMINAVIDAGKVPVIPRTICWGGTTNLLANVPVINAALAQLATTFPSAIVGPDLYSYFQANQSLINGTDHIHPTLPDGYAAYQQLWVNSLLASVYSQGSPFVQHIHRAFGRIQ